MAIVHYQEDLTLDRMDLAETLDAISKYGAPRIGKYDNGWNCSVNMFVTGQGVNFEVGTDFQQPSATESARTCLRLVLRVVREIKECV